MNTIDTALLAWAADAELEYWGPLEEATGEAMATHGLEVWADGDKSAVSGSACRAPSYWVQDETDRAKGLLRVLIPLGGVSIRSLSRNRL